jgi:pyridoxal/pyridoxine/pyridoxamine kinase
MEITLELTEKRMHSFLFAVQGVGVVFAAVFLAAYLGGLPTTNVLHNEPAFRIPLAVIGATLLILVLATVILSVYSRRTRNTSV